jgi:hypothetical protein
MPHDKHSDDAHKHGGHANDADSRAKGHDNDKHRRTFAEGTTTYPTPIQGLGGALTASAAGGNVSTLTPIPKTGFVGAFNHTIAGTITVGTAAGAAYQVPLHRLLQNYTFQNSLAFPYRSLNLDDNWLWANVCQGRGSLDAIYNSNTLTMPAMTSTGTKAFQFSFTDNIWLNDGVNFSQFLIAALTNSNDLTLLVTWAVNGTSGLTPLQSGTAVISSYTASDAVSCVYETVPDPDSYYWPVTSKVQQVIGDPSFSQTAIGLNSINLTPISGPDFLGLGIQVLSSGGTPDTLLPATTAITQVALLVGGSIPLATYTFSDLVKLYENTFGRQPAYGYLYIDMCSDLSIPNVMSKAMRKALATTKYAQLTVAVTLNSNYTTGTGAKINLLKRTRQAYAGNAAIS